MPTVSAARRLSPNEHRRWIETLTDAFRKTRRSMKGGPTDREALAVSNRIQKGTINLFHHVTVMLDDAIARGVSQADAESFGHAIVALVRSRFAQGPTPCLWTLVRNETRAQGAADIRQLELANPTDRDIAEAEELLSEHATHLNALIDELRRLRYTNTSRAA